MSIKEELINRKIETEIKFTAVRASGPGGQNVNKVCTQIVLRFNVINSNVLNDYEKELITTKLKNYINNEGDLLISAQEQRTQLQNKKIALENFYTLMTKALSIPKTRKKTNVPRAENEKRLDEKKSRSKRINNRKIDLE